MGIDPGLAAIGWGCITAAHQQVVALEYGSFTTSKRQQLPQRLQEIHSELQDLARKCQPQALAIEQIIFSSNQLTAIQVAQARGVAILAFAEIGIPVFEYSPLQIKQAVTGYGRADKEQVGKMTMRLLGLQKPPSPSHAADALAAALCHLFHSRLKNVSRK